MTGPLFLSRLRLNADAGFARLAPILLPDDPAARAGTTHRLVWTLFPQTLTTRPFLYREMAPSAARGRSAQGEILVLSDREPEDTLGLFRVDTKPFEPALAPGDHLAFALRANPARNRRDATGRATRSDVVMDALLAAERAHPGQTRAELRPEIIRKAGLDWLTAQAAGAGFRLPDPDRVAVEGYERIALARRAPGGPGASRAGHHRLDFTGVLEVRDPARFLARLAEGFGRARAFGHGLMLIRRA